MVLRTFLISSLFLLCSCQPDENLLSYESETLKITPLGKNSFVHTSFLKIKNYGSFPCNGLIVFHEGEALVFDTPVDDSATHELINWIKDTLKCNIKGVVVNHFHVDCLGGLGPFHARGISSFASNKTIELAKKDSAISPIYGFDTFLVIQVGSKKVINHFLGPGHTQDNIISYFPSDNVLFGGCLIKSKGAGKGNLRDADTTSWSQTVKRLKSKYSKTKIVVPGHGASGDTELLDYTIELFE